MMEALASAQLGPGRRANSTHLDTDVVPWGRCTFRTFEPLARYRVKVSTVATQTDSHQLTDNEAYPTLKSSKTTVTEGEMYPIPGTSQTHTAAGAISCETVAQTEAEEILPALPLEILNSAFGETVGPDTSPEPCVPTTPVSEKERDAGGSETLADGTDGTICVPSSAPTVVVTEGECENRVQGKVLVTLPHDNPACPFCGDHVGKPKALSVHMKHHHGGKDVEFQCSLCTRADPNVHSILCHIPKCKGLTPQEPAGDWACEVCARRFGTKSGLSQHKRRAHPVVRNAERIQASQPKQNSQRGKHKSCWSAEEELLLTDFDTMYSGEKYINKLIAEAIKTKTAKQVSDKRRLLNLYRKKSSGTADPGPGAQKHNLEVRSETPISTTGLKNSYMRTITNRLRASNRGPLRQDLEKFEAEVLSAWVAGDPNIRSLVETTSIDVLSSFLAPEHEHKHKQKGNTKGRKSKSGKGQSWRQKRATKRGTYIRFQHLFENDRCKLASIILDGTERLQCEIPLEKVFQTYKDKWESRTPFQGLGQFKSHALADNSAFDILISAKEVLKNISEMNKNSAPGPDKVSLKDLVRVDPEGDTLAGLFNTWLVTGIIPDGIKECRSLLIPKTMDPEALQDLGNWRPLTIGSIVLRLFSRILTNRLAKACPINARQRGFIAAPGCSENLKVLHTITKQAKKEKKPLGVVFIDIAKAFDSVSHDHIMWVLQERGLDQHIINIIGDSYRNVHTRMEVGKELTSPIAIDVGVKQGDPMSPLLFNLALDPLISTLETAGKGFSFGAQKVTALAFADDLVMLSDSWEGMHTNIQILESFCHLSGLKVQAKKCHGFLLSPTHDSFTVNNCEAWKIGADGLNMIAPGESEKYLGLKVDPWIGFSKPALSDKLSTWLERINRAPLKPSQKLEMLNTFTIPRVIYLADHTDCKKTLLSSLDDNIRRAVKEWLHLPADTCNSFLYTRSRDGGLGVTRLASLIPSIQARRLHRIAHSEDMTIRFIALANDIESEYQSLWLAAGGTQDTMPAITDPVTIDHRLPQHALELLNEWERPAPRVIYPIPCNWRDAEFSQWKDLPCQGSGVSHFGNDPTSNSWIKHLTGFSQRQFLTALKLRANVYPTREYLGRGKNEYMVKCRHCDAPYESLSHILGQCPAVQGARIRRHNKICEILTREARKLEWTVYQEPHLRTSTNELRKPDLVFVKDGTALVVDVTVRFEYKEQTFSDAAAEKVRHYQSLTSEISRLTGASKVRYFGFPLGARGKWPKINDRVLSALGLSESAQGRAARLLSRRALLYSIDVLNTFSGIGKGLPNSADTKSVGTQREQLGIS
uniref:ribonuclease H n=1 Tax=Chrysemys picta bellii TaxID=8478 RepID=A0A8C3F8X6_CHRPI